MAKQYGRDSIYQSRPYHAIYMSDDEEDDDSICVWDDRSDLSDFNNSDEEPLFKRKPETEPKAESSEHTLSKTKSVRTIEKPRSNSSSSEGSTSTKGSKGRKTIPAVEEQGLGSKIDGKGKQPERTLRKTTSVRVMEKHRVSPPSNDGSTSATKKISKPVTSPSSSEGGALPSRKGLRPLSAIPETESLIEDKQRRWTSKQDQETSPDTIDPTKLETRREREIQYALSCTRRNLTRATQFMLKLEARAGKTTKEGIRQTLDATVNDMNYDYSAPRSRDHYEEIEELQQLSTALYNRLYLTDRRWRKNTRDKRTGKSRAIELLVEEDIREWINVETNTNHLSVGEKCFYLLTDLAAGRGFDEWMAHLKASCRFRDHSDDEMRLVELAWRFLDRNMRGERPVNPTTVKEFLEQLERKRKEGVWDDILRSDPGKQVRDDEIAWKALKKFWSARSMPL